MISDDARKIVSEYYTRKIRVGVLGSHSALEVAHGAKQEGFETVVVCQKGREKTYTKHYRNLFDHVMLLDKFAEMAKPKQIKKFRELSTIFVPNRSFSTYVGYEAIEERFSVPIMGNRYMLRTEERDSPKNQHYLLMKSRIPTPKTFKSHNEIDRLVIVKVPEKERKIERAFFVQEHYWACVRSEQRCFCLGYSCEGFCCFDTSSHYGERFCSPVLRFSKGQ